MQDKYLEAKRGDGMDEKRSEAGPGTRKILHNRIVEIYCSTIFMLKNMKKILPVFFLAVKRIFSRKLYVFVLATPTHSNIGDQMIVFGMEKWCEKYMPDFICKEYDDGIYKDWSYFAFLKLVIKKGYLLFLRGGGSLGDRYIGYEQFIRHVLKSYPKNKIVMFPQSVSFSNTPDGEIEKKETEKAYDAHPDFTLYARDETSFALANEMFHRAKVRLCPDIAMFLFNRYQPKQYDRGGLFLCLRKDIENFYSDAEHSEMINSLNKQYDIRFGDTGAEHPISAAQRKSEIEELLSLFSKSSVTVTDRFHGVISAVLTGTPCVALRSEDHKIVSGIKWFEGVDFIFYAESLEDVPQLVKKAMQCKNPVTPDFSGYFDRIYEDILNG